jgi:hypothetical protein
MDARRSAISRARWALAIAASMGFVSMGFVSGAVLRIGTDDGAS